MSEAVSIKGTRDGLVIQTDGSLEIDELLKGLQGKFMAARGFFTGARVSFAPGRKFEPYEMARLRAVCEEHGLIPDLNPPAESPQAAETAGLTPAELENNCRLVLKDIRSGQWIHSEGHLTIHGNVHPGARISAAGSVLVLGSLRGTAAAGVYGDPSACVVAYSLKPAQLRIAGKIACRPDHDPDPGYPEIARIVDDRILVERYQAP